MPKLKVELTIEVPSGLDNHPEGRIDKSEWMSILADEEAGDIVTDSIVEGLDEAEASIIAD